MIYFFGATLKILPTTGMFTLGKGNSLEDLAAHLIMPVSLLAVYLADDAVGLQVQRGEQRRSSILL